MIRTICTGIGAVVIAAWLLSAFGAGNFMLLWTAAPMQCVPKESK